MKSKTIIYYSPPSSPFFPSSQVYYSFELFVLSIIIGLIFFSSIILFFFVQYFQAMASLKKNNTNTFYLDYPTNMKNLLGSMNKQMPVPELVPFPKDKPLTMEIKEYFRDGHWVFEDCGTGTLVWPDYEINGCHVIPKDILQREVCQKMFVLNRAIDSNGVQSLNRLRLAYYQYAEEEYKKDSSFHWNLNHVMTFMKKSNDDCMMKEIIISMEKLLDKKDFYADQLNSFKSKPLSQWTNAEYICFSGFFLFLLTGNEQCVMNNRIYSPVAVSLFGQYLFWLLHYLLPPFQTLFTNCFTNLTRPRYTRFFDFTSCEAITDEIWNAWHQVIQICTTNVALAFNLKKQWTLNMQQKFPNFCIAELIPKTMVFFLFHAEDYGLPYLSISEKSDDFIEKNNVLAFLQFLRFLTISEKKEKQ